MIMHHSFYVICVSSFISHVEPRTLRIEHYRSSRSRWNVRWAGRRGYQRDRWMTHMSRRDHKQGLYRG